MSATSTRRLALLTLAVFFALSFARISSARQRIDLSKQVDPRLIPSATQLSKWQSEIDSFDQGFRPTGSAADEGYIALLTSELASLGVQQVHTEPYTFSMWTPSNWSLAVNQLTGPSAINVSGYIPYSGETGPSGVTGSIIYLPGLSAAQAAGGIGSLNSLSTFVSQEESMLPGSVASLASQIQVGAVSLAAAIAAANVQNKIVLFDVPNLTLPMGLFTQSAFFVNDPNNTLTPTTPYTRPWPALIYVPVIIDALYAAGAQAVVGVLDYPEPAARGQYFPFFGTTAPNIPGLYVDRDNGAALKTSIQAQGLLGITATLTLNATVASVTSENIVGVIPGKSTREIVVSSHTDGPNSIEDNGPVGVLALASYFMKVPARHRLRTIRLVLTGGHFVGSKGMAQYVMDHGQEMLQNDLAWIEIEHTGSSEWLETAPGTMALTGQVEPQLIFTWPNPPLKDASIAFAKKFDRTIVDGPVPLGEGMNSRLVPLIQYITGPTYLLSAFLPQITGQFTDYGLMREQITAFAQMVDDVANAPANELGGQL